MGAKGVFWRVHVICKGIVSVQLDSTVNVLEFDLEMILLYLVLLDLDLHSGAPIPM